MYKKDKQEVTSLSLAETLKEARNKNKQIIGMINKIEDIELKQNIKDLSDTITKIIDTIYNQNIIYIIELSNENFKKLTEYYETKNEKITGNIVSMVEMCRKYIEKVE